MMTNQNTKEGFVYEAAFLTYIAADVISNVVHEDNVSEEERRLNAKLITSSLLTHIDGDTNVD